MLEKVFKLKANSTTTKTEIMAGMTTFMTMAYIIALNPNLLTGFGANGQDLWNGVFLATCIASGVGCIVMAFLANKPFAMAPGMGLNSFFALVVTNIVAMTGMSYLESFQSAMVIILVEGVVFLVLSVFNVREKIVNAIPLGVRLGIGPAIGLMLMNIGLGSNVGIYAEGNGFSTPFYVMRDFFGALTPSVIRGSMGDAGYTQMVLTVITMFVGLFVTKRTLCFAVRHSTPASMHAATTSAAGFSVSMPIISPMPLTDFTPLAPVRASKTYALFSRTPCSILSSSCESTYKAPAAHTGFPPNVEPWSP